MKLGILGTGNIVKDVLRFLPTLPITSFSILGRPASQEKTIALAESHGIEHCYFDYDELLASDVDTIYVALPNNLHFEFAHKALLAKKDVIIEKPITANLTELIQLNDLAKAQGCIILEAMNIHHLPAYQALKEQISEIGDIKIVNVNYSQYSSRYDAFKKGEILPAFDYHMAGGALMDINVYNVHTLVGLFGKPSRITYNANVERGIDTSGILLFDYERFKATSIGAKDCRAPITLTFQGDKGSIVINTPASQMTEFTIIYNNGEQKVQTFEREQHRLYYEFVEFIRIIEQRDMIAADALMEKSFIATELMEIARKQEGIVFDNDK